MENPKFESHSIMKFRFLDEKSPSIIYKSTMVVCGGHVPSRTTVFKSILHFKDGQLNIEDNPRCDRPITATNHETVKDVESLIVELQFSK